jgi:hypothetical protein
MLLRSEFCLDIVKVAIVVANNLIFAKLGAKICGLIELLTVKSYSLTDTSLI